MLFFALSANAQTLLCQENYLHKRTIQRVKIDGLIDDAAWKDAAVMTDLIEFRPKVGDKEDPANRTVAYIMYDDEGIYFGVIVMKEQKTALQENWWGVMDLVPMTI
jgi:hypothetical protein